MLTTGCHVLSKEPSAPLVISLFGTFPPLGCPQEGQGPLVPPACISLSELWLQVITVSVAVAGALEGETLASHLFLTENI